MSIVVPLTVAVGALIVAAGGSLLPPAISEPPQPPEDPRQHVDVPSARVAVAQDFQRIAESRQAKAEAAAKKDREETDALKRSNAGLKDRVMAAEAQVKALTELTLPTAIAMVAEMDGSTDQGDGEEGAGTGGDAAAGYKPQPPSRR
ncbi:hypothetical protein DA075_35595 (plasmid) [Methylobacterium currus]|uniref:Uncharacterized protein n=1 Tax=Methylobacterium currus TaxID=2051553 RepID=A0A2R4WXD8_9HYPH|nr:hypothetical protein [Methylobacterium currus]AWB26196.1 hypothetical protein DA075_35595 [Methylobacterium currus]